MMLLPRFCHVILICFSGTSLLYGQSFEADVKPLISRYCGDCHSGAEADAGIDFLAISNAAQARQAYEVWEKVDRLLAERKMPPEDEEQPSDEEVNLVRRWYHSRLVESIAAQPGVFQPRRLSATEYRNTLRSLFGFDLEVNVMEAEQTITEKSLVLKLLPTDPPGESGFRNDTHRNPLSTQIWEQYSYLADFAIEELFSEPRRDRLVTLAGEMSGDQFTAGSAAELIRSFVPQALRRDLPAGDLEAIVDRVRQDRDVVAATKRELKRTLMRPSFLYRGLLMPKQTGQQHVDAFELAERLSYFLWADMPDAALLEKARDQSLLDADVRRMEINRMLDSPKSHTLSTDFAVQWFLLDEIEQVSDNPPVMVALKSQPIDFFRYLLRENRPLMELIDSEVTFANPLTRKYYPRDGKQFGKYRRPRGIEIEIVPNQKLLLENSPERGGLLTMPGVLAMNRGPILRGVWMLERILGEHLPDPPADVGQVKANIPGENLSFRERFAEHRANETCAICHDKIDPLGFALDHYDDNGRYRLNATSANRKKNKQKEPTGDRDASGQLPTGEQFQNFAELKQILLTTQREPILRNMVKRMLSYALCRKIEIYDGPTIDDIVKEMDHPDATWRDLVFAVCDSLPFRETIVPEPHPDQRTSFQVPSSPDQP